MVIAYEVIAEVESLLAHHTNLSRTQIAKAAGVSREVVRQVALGLRGKMVYRPTHNADRNRGRQRRCGGCGALITTTQCMACAARSQRKAA